MALPMLPGCPDLPIGRAAEWTMWVQKLGDGYETRQLVGINALKLTWTVTFSARGSDVIKAIEDFLIARGADPFGFADPMNASATVAVFCDGWASTVAGRQQKGGNFGALEMTLRRAYGYD